MRYQLLFLFLFSCSDYKLESLKENDLPGSDLPSLIDTSVVAIDTGDENNLTDTAIEDPPEVEPSNPVAVCTVSPNPISPPFESSSWIGSDSYDPDGLEIINYDWQLISSPPGSLTSMPPGGAVRGPFTPELAGNYIARLVVTNEEGKTSDPCEANLEATPVESLWVEMFWEYPQDDMDLHLIANGGSLESREDCYYSNCTPSAQIFFPMDWGVLGYSGDNPTLDLDDIPGTGPENINIDTPQPGAIYTVVVHDYTGSTADVYGDNEVTINIYLDGSLSWTDTRVISGDGSYTYYARIDWNTSTITSL